MIIPDKVLCELKPVGGLSGLKKNLPKTKKIEEVSRIFYGLSDPIRLKIFNILSVQPVCVCVIKEIIKIADSKLSYHLSILKECRIITGSKEGNIITYSLTNHGKAIMSFTREIDKICL